MPGDLNRLTFAGQSFELQVETTALGQSLASQPVLSSPISLSVGYSAADIALIRSEEQLELRRLSESGDWEPAASFLPPGSLSGSSCV